MTEDLRERSQIHSGLKRPRSKSMPKGVNAKLLHAFLLQNPVQCAGHVSTIERCAELCCKYQIQRLPLTSRPCFEILLIFALNIEDLF